MDLARSKFSSKVSKELDVRIAKCISCSVVLGIKFRAGYRASVYQSISHAARASYFSETIRNILKLLVQVQFFSAK